MIERPEPPRLSVDWSHLRHAYGSAEDTPELLERLRGEDWEEALGDLYASVLHQGSVYPATLAALPFLVDIAHDPTAQGRVGALWLLASYAQSIAQGAGRVETYLPDGVDVEAFDRQARAALTGTGRDLLPLLEDTDPDVREAVYGYTAHLDDVAEVVPALRGRFDREDDPRAAVTLMDALLRHGAFDAADLATLVARGDDAVLFAAVWSAVATGHPVPTAVDHLVRLWPGQAEQHVPDDEGTSLEVLARAAATRAVPVLQRLQAEQAAPIDDLIGGWTTLATVSRSAAAPALDALLSLTEHAHTPETAARLVGALTQLLPTAPRRTPEACDAIVHTLARTNAAGTALRATAAVALFAAQDHRWTVPAAAVVAENPTEPMVVGVDASGRFSTALIGYPAKRRATAWAAQDLVDLAANAIAAWPQSTTAWIEVLATLPPTEAVVRTALPAIPDAAACALLAKIAADHPDAFTPPHRARITAAHTPDPAAAAWLTTAREFLSPTDNQDTAFTRAWRLAGGDEDADAALLTIWAKRPSPAFHATCLRVLDGTAHVSYPDQQRQLAAAQAVVDAGDPARAWPTVRAIVDEAGDPLPHAIAVGHRITARVPTLAREWAALLTDIAHNGREKWSGPNHEATARAVEALQVLHQLPADEAATLAITALQAAIPQWQAFQVIPTATRVLRTALTNRPDLRSQATQALTPFLSTDTRFPTSSDDIAEDVRLQATLRDALT
ncbi:MAG: hypothetical protein HOV94_18230 [Saccharothrix sp.]|nr:hypothetical protein [Saccharothrix sp.]